MALDNRLQVLIDDERLQRLRDESEHSGAPIGAIVREAIDQRLGSGDDASRRAALAALLAELPPEGIEPDWEYVKAEMLDARGAGDAGAPS
ncbi:MAG: hypothetical protein WKF40_09660 [Thermoleophilaceae bacterium]